MALFEPRDCKARSHMERLTYFVHNEHLRSNVLCSLAEALSLCWEALELTGHQHAMGPVLPGRSVSDLGGRSISLAQVVLEHGSATVGFEQYRPVLKPYSPSCRRTAP